MAKQALCYRTLPATCLKPVAQSCSSRVRLGKPGADFMDMRDPAALQLALGTGLALMCCCEGATCNGDNEAGAVLALQVLQQWHSD